MRKHGRPKAVGADRLRSYGAAPEKIDTILWQETGRWLNNRAENSHLPFRRRGRAMRRFGRIRCLQKFVSGHASVTNHFKTDRNRTSRAIFKKNHVAALAEWRQLGAA